VIGQRVNPSCPFQESDALNTLTSRGSDSRHVVLSCDIDSLRGFFQRFEKQSSPTRMLVATGPVVVTSRRSTHDEALFRLFLAIERHRGRDRALLPLDIRAAPKEFLLSL